ncbi:MAG: ABC-2 transporter permease [Clostridiales bacterium]|uniref:ABC-2 transporter permease n=1 Tax=Peptostreptococcus porci TaxID=2652282 RepID=UPI0029DD4AC3|nr:ABC-2 transporter permease [Peptostreptococcus porci]MCI5698703.1 ABC-2 transporter permease [Clostridiales bacterium]MDD7347265.1 ABC-2 transporter permease [Clostridiales bacterium]MDY4060798.1 ABC-2 transporter permease [Anaerovoracaceae bacterium]MDY4129002.1 ABC-2 transporter permease [Peptostreptococcus porci]
MTALIIKEFKTLRTTLILVMGLSIAIAGYCIYEKTYFIIPIFCVFMPMIILGISLGYDFKSDFQQFLFTMPISKGSYVLSKLFYGFAFGLLGAGAVLIIFMHQGDVATKYIVFLAILTPIVSIFLSSIQLPFLLKFGGEKGRIIMTMNFLLIFAISGIIKEKTEFLENIAKQLSQYSITVIIIATMLIGIILIWITVMASIKVLKCKEF